VPATPTFDFDGFMSAVQERRRQLGLSWMEFATVVWDQSDELNRHRNDHPL
jgi:hypothetical protein